MARVSLHNSPVSPCASPNPHLSSDVCKHAWWRPRASCHLARGLTWNNKQQQSPCSFTRLLLIEVLPRILLIGCKIKDQITLDNFILSPTLNLKYLVICLFLRADGPGFPTFHNDECNHCNHFMIFPFDNDPLTFNTWHVSGKIESGLTCDDNKPAVKTRT